MKIEEKTVFVIDGKSFSSEEKARAYEFDKIGEFVDKHLLHNILLGPRDRIKLAANVRGAREALIKLLEK